MGITSRRWRRAVSRRVSCGVRAYARRAHPPEGSMSGKLGARTRKGSEEKRASSVPLYSRVRSLYVPSTAVKSRSHARVGKSTCSPEMARSFYVYIERLSRRVNGSRKTRRRRSREKWFGALSFTKCSRVMRNKKFVM